LELRDSGPLHALMLHSLPDLLKSAPSA
jgi:hypothetical protein